MTEIGESVQRPPFDDSFSIVQIAKMDARWMREQLGLTWAATTIDGLLAEIERTEGDLAVAIHEAMTARAALAERDREAEASAARWRAMAEPEVWADPRAGLPPLAAGLWRPVQPEETQQHD